MINMMGRRIGRLVVIDRADSVRVGGKKNKRAAWLCQCDCGRKKVVTGYALRFQVRSCGCKKRKKESEMLGVAWVDKEEAARMSVAEVVALRMELELEVEQLCNNFVRRTRCQLEVEVNTRKDREHGSLTVQVKAEVRLP